MPEPLETQRLHPLSLVFMIANAARSLILPGLFVLFFSSGDRTEVWFMLLFLPAVAAGVVRYVTLRYELGPDELVIREGLVFKKVRHVPYARIQNVDTVQGPVQRWFGVTVVRLETAGGSEPEAHLRVLKMDRVEELRQSIFAGRGDAPLEPSEERAAPTGDPEPGPPPEASSEKAETLVDAPTEPVRSLHRLGPKDIILYGLADNRGSAVVAAASGVAWQFGLADRIEETFTMLSNNFGAFELALGALAFLVGLRLLSIVWAFLNLFDFRLARRADDLRASRGLLTRRTFTIPRHRIQTVSVRSSWLLRRMRREAVYVETAGSQDVNERELSRSVLVPITRRDEVGGIVREIEPAAWPKELAWQSVHPKARRRIATRWGIVAVLATLMLSLIGTPWIALGLPLPVAGALILASRRAKRLAYACTPEAVFLRDGIWTWRRDAIRHAKIQTVQLLRTPFDRRHGMASVVVDTAAAGPIPHRFCVPYLDEGVARDLARRLSLQAAATEFRWT